MKNNKTTILPYRFLPAIASANQHDLENATQSQTFSHFLRESIFSGTETIQQVYLLDEIRCINDTGISICGYHFEHVKKIYIHKYFNHGATAGIILLAIDDQNTKTQRFLKGLWAPEQSDVTVWSELMPDIARQEIAYLETIAE